MSTTLPIARVTALLEGAAAHARATHRRAGDAEAAGRPVHVLYGGAHLFQAETPEKLGALARSSFEAHAGDPATFAALVGLSDDALADELFARVRAKLHDAPIEAMTIDFEDGYGPRADHEEDADATRAAGALATRAASGHAAPRIGLRIKALGPDSGARGARTLDLFVSALVRACGKLPTGFGVTLPKVSSEAEVAALVTLLGELEGALGQPRGAIGVELMIEAPSSLVADDGTIPVRRLVNAAGARARAVHLGAYDLTAACGVAAPDQQLDHPLCDQARAMMQLALAGSDVAVVDGATTQLPIAPHRVAAAAGASLDAAQRLDNELAVREAWHLHALNVRRALAFGIHAGWDLHPAQLAARHGAVIAFYLEARAAMTARLARFVDEATRATRVGQVFDDAATGQGLLVFFLRGLACGAFDDADLAATGLSREELASRSFASIAAGRAGGAR
jgi:hypothetical protein